MTPMQHFSQTTSQKILQLNLKWLIETIAALENQATFQNLKGGTDPSRTNNRFS